MRLKIVLVLAAMMAAGLTAPAARAAVARQESAAAPSARQLDLTRQVIDLTMTKQFEDALHQLIAQQAATDPDARALPEEDRRFIVDLSAELTTDMIPQMVEAMVPIYARTFTEAELEAMIAFYGSETGRGIIEKTMTVMPEAMEAAMTVLPQLLDKMAARLCQHYGCEAGELETLQRQMRGESTVAAPASK